MLSKAPLSGGAGRTQETGYKLIVVNEKLRSFLVIQNNLLTNYHKSGNLLDSFLQIISPGFLSHIPVTR